MKKRTSKRRWLARFRLGKPVPMVAIVDHRLKLRGGECDPCRAVVRLKPVIHPED